MAINLISLVTQYLTPRMVGALARTVGIDEVTAQKLVTAAVPAILGALGTTVAAPGGAQRVSDAVSNADPDVLTKLNTALHGGNAQILTEGGALLSGLLGGSGLSSLAGALGQFADAPQGATQSAVGALSQLVMGTLGQQDPSNWSDAKSITSLFADQKSAISAAIPAELSKALGSTGLLAGLGAAAQTATTAASSAASSAARTAASAASTSASSAANRVQAAAPSASGFPTWAIVLIVIIVLLAIWWFMSHSQSPPEPAKQGMLESPTAVTYALEAPPRPIV